MPDPNPAFDQFASNRFNYPYTLRDNAARVDRANQRPGEHIYLENEYLEMFPCFPTSAATSTPASTRSRGKPMFYANPSIKKAAVGYRGAWAAFGDRVQFSRVSQLGEYVACQFRLRATMTDGSASAIVGNVDRVYGMEWTVELMLRPQSTLLEERVTLSEPQRCPPSLLLVE